MVEKHAFLFPVEASLVKPESVVCDETSVAEKVEKMLEIRRKLHENALGNIRKAQKCQVRQYDAKHNIDSKLKIGDKVLVKEMKNEGRKGGKLQCQFVGSPYTLAEDLGKGHYHIKNPAGNVLQTAISCHRLKLWLNHAQGRIKKVKYH